MEIEVIKQTPVRGFLPFTLDARSPESPSIQVDSLNDSKLFGGLLTQELHQLDQTVQSQLFPAGASIFSEGDPGDGIYVIAEGTVHIVCRLNDGHLCVLAKLGPGDFFGEMAMLDEGPRSATALAETEVRVHFIPREDLLTALEGRSRLAVRLVREFSLRMRDFNRQHTKELLQAERLALVGRFARTIIHDFKNPLSVVGMALELAASESATSEMRQKCRARGQQQLERMSGMLSELLEFARGGTGSTVALWRLDYAEYVKTLLQELRPEMEARKVTLLQENELPSTLLMLDPVRLSHVFHNLLNNACDAMPDGGKVTVRFRKGPQSIITEVEDSGAGIASEIAPRLFKAFATYGKTRGTGLVQ